MRSLFILIRQSIKNSFDNIHNENLKHNLLQAIPFWIGSFITGVFAVFYAQLFQWGENLMHAMMNWHSWLIFIVSPVAFVLSWWLVKRFAPYGREAEFRKLWLP